MTLRGAATGAVVAVGLALSGCSAQSERDQYSYDAIQDDGFAQDKYLTDQGYLVDSQALTAKGAELESWVALQTDQICDQLSSGTTFDELVGFFSQTFGDVVTDPEGFVGNAAGYSCSGYLD
ncbi:hypothetical protein EKO23_04540 [Nocardioides guangzhouensis]|uniref:DUF732 domain-containing protein n=1 Tax=Nocardioides guangzhouensis TaxID=2497878 RepID=A0A4Q4ZIN3_9ACTN|nr:hypothetical protein [Nocardioides guangzhouensis]RYP88110.1 hypothetical protein EKO23_04540 [Nocardioides guangzhouensis]